MIEPQKLTYNFNELEPYISEKTIRFHYEKHYMGYVNTTNSLIKGTDLETKSIEEIILTASSDTIYTKLFNNASQSWNHEFFWKSLTPELQKHRPSAELLKQINKDFGDMAILQKTLIEKGIDQFASGWVWLVKEKENLKVISTSNANTPLTESNLRPLLCIDVWEHAYYLDYQNLRKDYLTGIVGNLLNWESVSQNFEKIN